MGNLRDELINGIKSLRAGFAWVAFWQEGDFLRSESVYLDKKGDLYPKDKKRLKEILSFDHAAVILNGYYSGELNKTMSAEELLEKVHWYYDNGVSRVSEFIDAVDPETIKKLLGEA